MKQILALLIFVGIALSAQAQNPFANSPYGFPVVISPDTSASPPILLPAVKIAEWKLDADSTVIMRVVYRGDLWVRSATQTCKILYYFQTISLTSDGELITNEVTKELTVKLSANMQLAYSLIPPTTVYAIGLGILNYGYIDKKIPLGTGKNP